MDFDITYAAHRVAYEAFSKLSRKISDLDDIDELTKQVDLYIKYVFNYRAIRIIINQPKFSSVFCFPQARINDKRFWKMGLLESEKKLFENSTPIQESIIDEDASGLLGFKTKEAKLWGWKFSYRGGSTIMTLISDKMAPFTSSNVEILGLVVDLFTLKLVEIRAKKNVLLKNKQLELALETIQEKNNQINQIVENQQQVIEDRTKSVVEKNEQLKKLSRLNAHKVREPLSRILGLIQIVEHMPPTELPAILNKLSVSAKDLDEALQIVINKSLEDIEEEFEL